MCMTWVLIAFVALLVLNVPIAFVIGLSGSVYFLLNGQIPLSVMVNRVVAQTQSYSFLAVPFFIFAGSLMNETGITKGLLKLANMITRHIFGGLAQTNILLSTMMGGVSGSACADASMEARVLGFDMLRRGYPKGYTVAVTCPELLDYRDHSAQRRPDSLRLCWRRIHRTAVYGWFCSGHPDVHRADDHRNDHRQKTRLRAPDGAAREAA